MNIEKFGAIFVITSLFVITFISVYFALWMTIDRAAEHKKYQLKRPNPAAFSNYEARRRSIDKSCDSGAMGQTECSIMREHSFNRYLNEKGIGQLADDSVTHRLLYFD